MIENYEKVDPAELEEGDKAILGDEEVRIQSKVYVPKTESYRLKTENNITYTIAMDQDFFSFRQHVVEPNEVYRRSNFCVEPEAYRAATNLFDWQQKEEKDNFQKLDPI